MLGLNERGHVPGAHRWALEHPHLTSVIQGLIASVYVGLLFDDLRPAVLAFVATVVLSFAWRKPGGLGEKLLTRSAQEVAARGGQEVRPTWLVKGVISFVVAAVLLCVLLNGLIALLD